MLLCALVMSNQQDFPVTDSMASTIQQVLREAMQRLHDRVDDAYTDCQVLLAHALNQDRVWLIAHGDDELDDVTEGQFTSMVDQRRRGVPVAHITGVREFWSLPFKVTKDTLIPRPETEHLVEQVLSLPLPGDARVLDYGTGSGIIAITLAKEKPAWHIDAIDCSAETLAIARENADRLGVGIDFTEGCSLDGFSEANFDVIVSNPPYVRDGDEHLLQGDVRFEPLTALTSGIDGLDCIRYLVSHSGRYLRPSGYLVLEHGYDQAESVREILQHHGFIDIRTVQDLAGNDRLTCAQWSAS